MCDFTFNVQIRGLWQNSNNTVFLFIWEYWYSKQKLSKLWKELWFVDTAKTHQISNIRADQILFLVSTLTCSALVTASALSSATFPVSRRRGTSRPPRCTPWRSWTPNPIRTHCGSTRSALRRNCVWPPSSTDCCRSHPRRCRNTGPHSGDTRSWSCGTVERGNENNNIYSHHSPPPHRSSTTIDKQLIGLWHIICWNL